MLSSMSIVPFLFQITVVARPPVEVQVRVNTGVSVARFVTNWKVIFSRILTWPASLKKKNHHTKLM